MNERSNEESDMVKPDPMSEYDWLMAYSEWLDAEQDVLIAPDGDERTHDELVSQFLYEFIEVVD